MNRNKIKKYLYFKGILLSGFFVLSFFIFLPTHIVLAQARDATVFDKLPDGTLFSTEWNALLGRSTTTGLVYSNNLPLGNFVNTFMAATMYGPLGINIAPGTQAGVGATLKVKSWGSNVMSLFNSSDAEVFSVMNSGNVGIGATNPAAKLNISDTTSAGINEFIRLSMRNDYGVGAKISWYHTASAESANITGAWNAGIPDTSYLSFSNYSSGAVAERMRITGNNVGIGTTAPNDRFSFTTTGVAAPAGSDGTGHNYTSTYLASDNYALANYGVVKTLISNATSSIISTIGLWGGATTSNIWALNSGNVGIGTTTPTDKLVVVGNIDLPLYNAWRYIKNSATNGGLRLGTGNSSGVYTDGIEISSGGGYVRLNHNTTVTGNLYTTSNLGVGTTTPSAALHIKAGTASAGTAPIKFSTGTLLSTIENGAIEYDGSSLYLTAAGVRDKFAMDLNTARYVAQTSSGNGSDANTWTKIASINPGASNYSNFTILLSVNGASSGGGNVIVSLTGRQNAAASPAPSEMSAKIVSSNNIINNIGNDAFKIINEGYGTEFGVYMKKTTAWGSFRIYELSKNFGGTITYLSTQGWSGVEPSGTYSITSSLYELGNMGIGTSAPNDRLSISTTGVAAPIGSDGTGHNYTSTYLSTDDYALTNYGVVKTLIASATSSSALWGGSTSGNIWSLNSANVGIGTSSPTEKLDVVGNIHLSSGNYIQFGTAGSHTLITDDASNGRTSIRARSNILDILLANGTAWGTIRAATLAGSSGASGNLTIDSTSHATKGFVLINPTGGNVGIGTTTPTHKLEIKGGAAPWSALKISSSDSVAGAVYAGQASSLYGYIGSSYYYNSSLWRTMNTAGSNIVFNNDGSLAFTANSGLTANTDYTPTERMRITTAGNVGIGTSAPNDELSISTTGVAAPAGSDGTGHNYTSTYLSTDDFALANYGVVRTLIASATSSSALWGGSTGGNIWSLNSTNVGIGTTNPSVKLHVAGAGATNLRMSSFDSPSSRYLELQYTADANGPTIEYRGLGTKGNYLTFTNSGTARMTIDSNGNVGIGTTSPVAKLDITAPDSTSDMNQLRIGSASNNYGSYTFRQRTTGGYANQYLALDVINNAGTFLNTMAWSGANVGIGTTNPGNKLDIRNTAAADPGNVSLLNVQNNTAQAFMYSGQAAGITFKTGYNSGANVFTSGAIYLQAQNHGIDNGGLMVFQTANSGGTLTNAMVINKTGNLGIGTTAPNDKLSISTTGVAAPAGSDGTGHNYTSTYLSTDDFALANYGVVKTLIASATSSSALWGGGVGGAIWSLNSGNVGVGTTNPQAKLDVVGSMRLGSTTRSTWTADAPIFQMSLYGANGDLPFRTSAVSPVDMRLVYGPFAYSQPACGAGYSKWYRVYVEYVDSIQSGGQSGMLRIGFSGGTNRDFNLGSTWGGAPSYRTYLSSLFQETNTEHATMRAWVSGTAGPYLEIRKAELWSYCL